MEEKSKMVCRFYENEYPAEDDLVMVRIVSLRGKSWKSTKMRPTLTCWSTPESVE
jgi:hypothetical protein